MAESKQTTDHDTIRSWVEERGGRPARVRDTGNGDDPGEESRFSKLVSR